MSTTKPTRLTNFDKGNYRSLDIAFQAIPGQSGYYTMKCYQVGGWSMFGVQEAKTVKTFCEAEGVRKVYSISDDALEGIYRGTPTKQTPPTEAKAQPHRLTKKQVKALQGLVDHELSSNEDEDGPALSQALIVLDALLTDTKAKGFTLIPWYGEQK